MDGPPSKVQKHTHRHMPEHRWCWAIVSKGLAQCSRSLHSSCLGWGSNPYSPRYNSTTLTKKLLMHLCVYNISKDTKRYYINVLIEKLLYKCSDIKGAI